jgi:hypothetical protein
MNPKSTFRISFICTLMAVIAIGLAIPITGCKSTSGLSTTNSVATNTLPVIDRQAALDLGAAALKIASKTGTVLAVQKKPETRAYFETAKLALDSLINDGKYAPEDLQRVLAGIKSEDPLINSAISDVMDIYQAAVGRVTSAQISRAEWLPPMLKAIRDGIAVGLQLVGK